MVGYNMPRSILDGKPLSHAVSIVNWAASDLLSKYSAGQEHYGGYLPEKGGLLREIECEVLDQAVYARTIRLQLEGILDALNRGEVKIAKDSLRMMLRGSTKDRLPSAT